jgi:hypothetical protein
MPNDTIKSALEVAAKKICCWADPCQVDIGAMTPPCCRPWHHERAAAAIAAFLEALPEDPGTDQHANGCVGQYWAGEGDERTSGYWAAKRLAAAVRRAAGGGE